MERRSALSSDPNNARLLNNYGAFLLDRERYQEALEYFNKAAADTLYSERSRVFENMGIAYLRMGNTDAARENLERSLRLNNRQPRALLELAQLEFNSGDFVPAWNHFRRFDQLSEQNATSLWLGVRLARRFEDHSKAASYALQLKRLYPNSPEDPGDLRLPSGRGPGGARTQPRRLSPRDCAGAAARQTGRG